jgi:1,2-dihydroxy-3-keto-5-methylthiopentene dioxygenase
MVMLRVMSDDNPDDVLLSTTDFDTAAERLRTEGVRLRRWAVKPGSPTMTDTEVLAAYADEIAALREAESFTLVDSVRLVPEDSAQWRESAGKARQSFRSEHRHTEDEVRFFAAGRGCFYLHLPPTVLAVVGEAGDLLSVPAGTTHWFDMGPTPDFCAVRFFEREDGWIGDFTGSDIATRFPDLPALLDSFGR